MAIVREKYKTVRCHCHKKQ